MKWPYLVIDRGPIRFMKQNEADYFHLNCLNSTFKSRIPSFYHHSLDALGHRISSCIRLLGSKILAATDPAAIRNDQLGVEVQRQEMKHPAIKGVPHD